MTNFLDVRNDRELLQHLDACDHFFWKIHCRTDEPIPGKHGSTCISRCFAKGHKVAVLGGTLQDCKEGMRHFGYYFTGTAPNIQKTYYGNLVLIPLGLGYLPLTTCLNSLEDLLEAMRKEHSLPNSEIAPVPKMLQMMEVGQALMLVNHTEMLDSDGLRKLSAILKDTTERFPLARWIVPGGSFAPIPDFPANVLVSLD